MRLIKKYPNRRLYDTSVSSYIKLGDVRDLVLAGRPLRVQDSRTKKDITRNILLQIILEQEDDGEPIFSTVVLEQIIRFYGDDLQAMIASYLERSMTLFIESQEQMRRQRGPMTNRDPAAAARHLAQKQWAMWREMQASFYRPGTLPNPFGVWPRVPGESRDPDD